MRYDCAQFNLAVLSPDKREQLLKRCYDALVEGGILILTEKPICSMKRTMPGALSGIMILNAPMAIVRWKSVVNAMHWRMYLSPIPSIFIISV